MYVYVCKRGEVLDSEALYRLPKHGVPVGEVFQLNLQRAHTQTHTHIDTDKHTHRGSSPGLSSRMLDSLKILVNGEMDTMECFVGDVSASVLPERIFLSQSSQKSVCVFVCVYVCESSAINFGTIFFYLISSKETRNCIPLSPPSFFVCFIFSPSLSADSSLLFFYLHPLFSLSFIEGIL